VLVAQELKAFFPEPFFYENATGFQGRYRVSGALDPGGVGLNPGFLPAPRESRAPETR